MEEQRSYVNKCKQISVYLFMCGTVYFLFLTHKFIGFFYLFVQNFYSAFFKFNLKLPNKMFSRCDGANYRNYFIINEKAISYITYNVTKDDLISKNLPEFSFYDSSQFASLKFSYQINVVTKRYCLWISDIGNSTVSKEEPLAEIIFWKWEQGTQQIKNTTVLKKGRSVSFDVLPISVVIRFLKKRELVDNPCPPICSPGDDLTVRIGDRQLTVSAHWLMSVSPMVKRMLSVDMKEKRERVLNLDGHDITMEQFIEFMGAISATSFRHPFFPNPKNVLTFLWFADYFQIDWLKERCGVHLANCVEIPFSERFLLIERYKLNNLMQYFTQLLNELTQGK